MKTARNRNPKADGDGDNGNFNNGPIKIKWVKIMPNVTVDENDVSTTTLRVYFKAEDPNDATVKVHGYFPFAGNVAFVVKLVDNINDPTGHKIKYTSNANDKIRLQFLNSYQIVSSVFPPPTINSETSNQYHELITDISDDN